MNDFSLNQSSPVASYVDGVYKGNPAIQGVQIFDLDRVEVLRGPQGTLYGRNSTGGAVNFISHQPDFSPEGYVKLGYGSHNRYDVEATLQGPIVSEKVAGRIAGILRTGDGWQRNRTSDVENASAIDEYGIRASLRFEPSELLDATLRLTTSRQDAANYGIVPFNISPAGAGAGLYSLYALLGLGTSEDYNRPALNFTDIEAGSNAHHVVETDSASLTLNFTISDTLQFTSVSSWDDGIFRSPEDTDGTPLDIVSADYSASTEQISQDTRLTSDFRGKLNFILGAYFDRETTFNTTTLKFYQDIDLNGDGSLNWADCEDVFQTAFEGTPATPSGRTIETALNSSGLSLAELFPAGCQAQNAFQQIRQSKAAYLDATYDVADRLTAHLGLRITNDKTSLNRFSAEILGSDSVPILNTIPFGPAGATAPLSSAFTDDVWTGTIGVDYQLFDDTMMFLSLSKGYRNGAYNAQAFFDPAELTEVRPEKLDSVEAGLKSRFYGNRIQFNASVFHYIYHDQQFLDVDNATAVQRLVNIEKSSISGAEFELTARATDRLTLNLGAGLLDTRVDQGTLNGIDVSGNKLILAPRLSLTGAIDWELAHFTTGTLSARMESSFTGDQFFDVFNTERLKQKAYTLTNMRLDWKSKTGSYRLGLWTRNLFNEEHRTSAIDLSRFGFDYSHVGQSRSVGIDAGYEF